MLNVSKYTDKVRISEIQSELHLGKNQNLETTSKKLFKYMYNSEEKVKPHWSEDGREINGNSDKVSKLWLVKNKNSEQSRMGYGSESLKLKIYRAEIEAEISKPHNLSSITVKELAQETEDWVLILLLVTLDWDCAL